MWAVVGEFGFVAGLCAVGLGLLGVRRADRDVEGGVGVAKGGGQDVGGSELSARNEAGTSVSAVQSQEPQRAQVQRPRCGRGWPRPRRDRWRGRRPCPGIRTDRKRRAPVHRVRRSPGAGVPSRRTSSGSSTADAG